MDDNLRKLHITNIPKDLEKVRKLFSILPHDEHYLSAEEFVADDEDYLWDYGDEDGYGSWDLPGDLSEEAGDLQAGIAVVTKAFGETTTMTYQQFIDRYVNNITISSIYKEY